MSHQKWYPAPVSTAMTVLQRNQLESLIQQAVDLPPHERVGFLQTLDQQSPDLRAQLESLLEVHGELAPYLQESTSVFGHTASASQARESTEYGYTSQNPGADPYRLIGMKIHEFQVLDLVGIGGMGVVYRAQDTRLPRHVALKLLPPEWAQDKQAALRLLREAQAASSVDHPNVCTIYKTGETEDGRFFIAMACYEGETLKSMLDRGPIGEREALTYASQIARGLSHLHQKDIVHRDLKPANVFVTEERLVKILDFGIAKTSGPALTKAGHRVGTAHYMSPEQARGDRVDHRTDIWSFGALLFEMVTGARPFSGDYELAVLYAVLYLPPTLPVPGQLLSPGVEKIINRALEKDPERRYGSADELLRDLDSILSSLHGNRQLSMEAAIQDDHSPHVVVLPFIDFSPDKDQEYFCDGLAEEVIYTLAQIPNVRVIARTSAFAFKGKGMDVREIGRQLHAGSVLEGSVRRSGNRLRVTAQLIDVKDGYHLWAEQFNREAGDIFTIQEEISQSIAERVRGGNRIQEGFVRHPTEDFEAYTLLLKGRFYLHKETPDALQKAAHFFKNAAERDPRMAAAHVGLAHVYVHQSFHDFHPAPPRETHARAREALEEALHLDANSAEAHAVLGAVRNLERDWKGAEEAYRQALKLNPSEPALLGYYPWQLATTGRISEALTMLYQAEKADPLRLQIKSLLSLLQFYALSPEQALAQCDQMVEIEPNFHIAHQLRGIVKTYLGEFEGAHQDLLRVVELVGRQSHLLKDLGCLYAAWGKREEAYQVIRELEALRIHHYVNPSCFVFIHQLLGDSDAMCEWLDVAIEEQDTWLVTLAMSPLHADARFQPAFQPILQRMGLHSDSKQLFS